MARLLDVLEALSARLNRSDMAQLATLLMAVLMVALIIGWPPEGHAANDSWYVLVQARAIALSLMALGYGASRRQPDRAALGCLLLLALLSLPLELLGYLVSFPGVPFGYSALLVLLHTVAMFGIGYLLGGLLAALRLAFVTPLAVPALLVGLSLLDWRLGTVLFSPLAALTEVSLRHLALMAGVALATLVGVLRAKEGS